ncbi:hypothetical protein DFH09DRAFT_1069567 [Mycena vulgaris]|nr:hypothetical protein DFH09DRAFT_1069567 [Mycena vulgaris]
MLLIPHRLTNCIKVIKGPNDVEVLTLAVLVLVVMRSVHADVLLLPDAGFENWISTIDSFLGHHDGVVHEKFATISSQVAVIVGEIKDRNTTSRLAWKFSNEEAHTRLKHGSVVTVTLPPSQMEPTRGETAFDDELGIVDIQLFAQDSKKSALVEHFKFFAENFGEKCFEFYNNFSPENAEYAHNDDSEKGNFCKSTLRRKYSDLGEELAPATESTAHTSHVLLL